MTKAEKDSWQTTKSVIKKMLIATKQKDLLILLHPDIRLTASKAKQLEKNSQTKPRRTAY